MCAVNIGIGHGNNAVISQFFRIIGVPYSPAKGNN